jgi:hypothetical protein
MSTGAMDFIRLLLRKLTFDRTRLSLAASFGSVDAAGTERVAYPFVGKEEYQRLF